MIAGIYSCKKNDSIRTQYAKLIVGTWKSTGQNTKVYDLSSNELVKDSTITFTGNNANRAWLEIYLANGNSYVTTIPTVKSNTIVATADTTSYLTYTILGSNLLLKQNIGGEATKPILRINTTDMDLESTTTGTLPASWKLGINVSYKITQSTHYIRQ
ncbi:hypothetical protein GCM10022392_29250 [Mucilaginibacter panaciglaebae]|uniref:Lipocalin-like protein n=2 Tax=Mucilaginibacter panaciglaebae TaxID=502331 RepID=A0ABP7X2M1_9SPHI